MAPADAPRLSPASAPAPGRVNAPPGKSGTPPGQVKKHDKRDDKEKDHK